MSKLSKSIFLFIGALIFIGLSVNSLPEKSFANTESSPINMNIPIIEDIRLSNFNENVRYVGSTKGLELSCLTAVNYLENTKKWSLSEMLKTKYPEVNDANIDNYSFSVKDCINFINEKGSNRVKWSSNFLTQDIIRENIKNGKPIILYLKANKPENYWIESVTAVIIYGYTYLNFGPGQVIFDIVAYSPNHSAPLMNLDYMDDINLLNGMYPVTTFKYEGSIIFN